MECRILAPVSRFANVQDVWDGLSKTTGLL